jgi:hypothetical protein
MATRVQVSCINKSDRDNPYERILNIGGVDSDGNGWKISQEEAITRIESGASEFFVTVLRQEVNIIVAVSQSGNKYIKTEADGEQPNNLLSLAECS